MNFDVQTGKLFEKKKKKKLPALHMSHFNEYLAPIS